MYIKAHTKEEKVRKAYTREKKARYAEKAWPHLVLTAEQGNTIFYSDLGEEIDIDNNQEVRHALSPIQNYCLNHKVVPHLTSLVVKKPPKNDPNKTPEPGIGYTPKLGSHKEDKDAVHAFNWKEHPNPGYAILLEHATE